MLQHQVEGNNAIIAKDYNAAVRLYTEGRINVGIISSHCHFNFSLYTSHLKKHSIIISLPSAALEISPDGPNSHIFYSNRAAAHCYLTSYELAVSDCEASINLSPSYAKGYTRLGQAQYAMKNFEAAVDAYKKACELDPKNKVML